MKEITTEDILARYWVFWYDKYSNGFMAGHSHAVDTSVEEWKSLCGLVFDGHPASDTTPIDGGYQNCAELVPSCKRCRKSLGLDPNGEYF